MLGGMLTRWYHLAWDDKEEKGILQSFNNDKMQGTPKKFISLKQCAPGPCAQARACVHAPVRSTPTCACGSLSHA